MGLLLNTFYYLSTIYPHFSFIFDGLQLPIFTFIFEAIVTIIGFHIFCLFHMSFIDQLYEATNNQTPTCIKRIFKALQVFVFTMAIICYSFVFIFIDFYSIVTFYILYHHYYHQASVTKLKSAKRTIIILIFVLLLICIVCVVDILFNLQFIRYGTYYDDDRYGSDIFRSSFIITMMMILVFWTYSKDGTWFCWNYRTHSVMCCIYRCSEYRNYIVITSPIKDKPMNGINNLHKMNLLDTPTPTPINLTINTDLFGTPRTLTNVTSSRSTIDADGSITADISSCDTATLIIAEDTTSTTNTL